MYIGENLNEKQVAVLQAIADTCGGCQLARVAKVVETIKNSTRFQSVQNEYGEIRFTVLDKYIDQLVAEYLVERKDYKGQPHVGLTEDGKRCNRIDLLFPL
jgi:DNA-binding HxlR family transcriptional regulator